MSINVPGIGPVTVAWVPSPDRGIGRAGMQPIAIVHHRAVSSSLAGIVRTLSTKDTRLVSATFAIGHEAGKPKVVQLVDLSDTAWCNGDCQQRTYPAEPSNWDRWYGHRGHNERTISIEHEDQGGSTDATKKGIVTEDLIRTSIALDRLLLSGDLAAIRAAGIRCLDAATAAALGKITPTARTLINHHDIAGKLKPYCWRPWKADKVGFPRSRYVTELTPAPPQEDPMVVVTDKSAIEIDAKVGAVITDLNGARLADVATQAWRPSPFGIAGARAVITYVGGSNKLGLVKDADIVGRRAPATVDCTAAVKAATDPLNARITTVKGKVAALAADIAND